MPPPEPSPPSPSPDDDNAPAPAISTAPGAGLAPPVPAPVPVGPPSSSSSSSTTALPLPVALTLLDHFSTFLTVAVHTILYHRGLYPAATFLASRAYNLPVYQSRHPALCAWVVDAVAAVREQLVLAGGLPPPPSHHQVDARRGGNTGGVERVAVVIHADVGGDGASGRQKKAGGGGGVAVLERWVFDVSSFPQWPSGALSASAADEGGGDGVEGGGALDDDEGGPIAGPSASRQVNDNNSSPSGVNWTDVHEALRGALQRVAFAAQRLGPLPAAAAERCGFTVAVELRDDAEAPVGHPQLWIPSEPELQTASSRGRTRAGRDVGGARTTPVRAVEAGPLFFECWVEEGAAKEALLQKSSGQKINVKSAA